MEPFGVPLEAIREGLDMVSKVETLRANYMKKKAESQNATDQKNAALRKTDEWMSDFFAMATIATRDYPQLREAFVKIVKS